MAFPVPAHLPRKQDVSSKILGKLDQATHKNLNAALANSWLVELDETIQNTSVCFSSRFENILIPFTGGDTSANTGRLTFIQPAIGLGLVCANAS